MNEPSYLKKCAPTMRPWDLVFSPTRWRSRVDVLLANMQWEGQTFSISLNIVCLRVMFSMTACKWRIEYIKLLFISKIIWKISQTPLKYKIWRWQQAQTRAYLWLARIIEKSSSVFYDAREIWLSTSMTTSTSLNSV